MDIQERLAEFFRRLEAAPPASTAEEALRLVCQLIEEVEDELCPLPREEPPPTEFTGRMYAPQEDMVKPRLDGSLVATTRRHVIYCGSDGAIRIAHRFRRSTVLVKPGKMK
jgi:hypothetical protein